jgi:hypothetical protein
MHLKSIQQYDAFLFDSYRTNSTTKIDGIRALLEDSGSYYAYCLISHYQGLSSIKKLKQREEANDKLQREANWFAKIGLIVPVLEYWITMAAWNLAIQAVNEGNHQLGDLLFSLTYKVFSLEGKIFD